jgi:hypothetical protein
LGRKGMQKKLPRKTGLGAKIFMEGEGYERGSLIHFLPSDPLFWP